MINQLLDYINIVQLEVLGFKREYFFILFLIFCLLVLSVFIMLLMNFLSSKKYLFALTFLLSSLFFLTIAAILSQLYDHYNFFQFALQSVILYGVILSVYMLYKFVKLSLFL